MFSLSKASWLLVSLLITNAAVAAEYKFSCPKQIRVTQKIAKTHAGWRALSDQFHRNSDRYDLNGVSMYTDAPEKLVSLKPDHSTTEKAQWQFNASDKTYIVCEYQNTSVQLTKALPDQTSSCQVIFLKNVSTAKGPIPDYIICVRKGT